MFLVGLSRAKSSKMAAILNHVSLSLELERRNNQSPRVAFLLKISEEKKEEKQLGIRKQSEKGDQVDEK